MHFRFHQRAAGVIAELNLATRAGGFDSSGQVLRISHRLAVDGDDDRVELLDQGELKVRPGDDSLRRMREALDTIAMGTDEAHGRLLEALTRPGSLQPLPPSDTPAANEQTSRQFEAKALALNTPDIACTVRSMAVKSR